MKALVVSKEQKSMIFDGNTYAYGLTNIAKKDIGKVTVEGRKCYLLPADKNKYITDGDKGWGGNREGAGRKCDCLNGEKRKMRSLRATEEEWEQIKEYAQHIKKGETKMETVQNIYACGSLVGKVRTNHNMTIDEMLELCGGVKFVNNEEGAYAAIDDNGDIAFYFNVDDVDVKVNK